jgi:hypothetical protein
MHEDARSVSISATDCSVPPRGEYECFGMRPCRQRGCYDFVARNAAANAHEDIAFAHSIVITREGELFDARHSGAMR